MSSAPPKLRGSHAAQAGDEYHPPPNAIDADREQDLRRIAGLPINSGDTPPPNATETRSLGSRVDYFEVAFRLDRDRIAARVLNRLGIATLGPVALTLGKFSFALKAREQSSHAWFENADLRGTLDLKAAGGWSLELTVRAVFLASHPLEETLRLVGEVADAFGRVLEGPRLRRCDLAGDFVGFPLSELDAPRFATMRAGLSEFRAEAKDFDQRDAALDGPKLRIYRSKVSKVTGFFVGAGNAVSARVYDKTAELNVPGRDEKRAFEHALWEQREWKGNAVTRVEFQFRGEALDQFGIRNPLVLPSKLDGLWQYGAGWLRLIDPESASRRHRCALDPRWVAVRDVTFVHQASPAVRIRCRGGAKPEHALGASLSMLASLGQLKRIDTGWDRDGVILDERAFMARMNEADARAWACEQAIELCGNTGLAAMDEIAAKRGWRIAALILLTRINAAVARFSSIDDLPKGVQI